MLLPVPVPVFVLVLVLVPVVLTAIWNSGFQPPRGRLTVNLAPADVKKEGAGFEADLAGHDKITSDHLHEAPGRALPIPRT